MSNDLGRNKMFRSAVPELGKAAWWKPMNTTPAVASRGGFVESVDLIPGCTRSTPSLTEALLGDSQSKSPQLVTTAGICGIVSGPLPRAPFRKIRGSVFTLWSYVYGYWTASNMWMLTEYVMKWFNIWTEMVRIRAVHSNARLIFSAQLWIEIALRAIRSL